MAKTTRAKRNLQASGRVSQAGSRWTRVCAWDGHELGEMDYVQVSDHERVCRFHYPQFQVWVDDVSQRMFRADGSEEDDVERATRPMLV